MISFLKTRTAIVIGLFGIALLFATLHLRESPSVWYDEGWYIQTSSNLAATGIDGIQLSPGNIKHISILTVGYPLIFPLGLLFKIAGTDILVGRSLMVAYLLLFLVVTYYLARRLFGAWPAVAALAVLATFPPLYGNGKSVLGEVPGMLYLMLSLLLFNISLSANGKPTRRRLLWLAVAGLASGLAVATKPLFILLIPALAVGAFVGWKFTRITIKDMGIFLVCLLVPIVVWVIIQFGLGDSLVHTLTFYANPYHEVSLVQTVFRNFRMMFTDSSTLFTLGIFAIWTVAVGVNLFGRRINMTSDESPRQIAIEEVIAYVFTALVILAFLRTGGFYRYLFQAQVTMLLFFPYSLIRVYVWAANRFGHTRRFRLAAVCLISVVSILGAYQVLFHSWVADAYASNKTAFWQEYFAQAPAETSFFFYDVPEVVPFILTRNYYQFLLAPAGSSTGSEGLDVLRSGDVDMVIIQSDEYDAEKDRLLSKYVIDQQVYKYTILSLKNRRVQ